MQKSKSILFVCISIVSMGLFAQNVTLEYSEGRVEYQKGTSWTTFNIGDSIAVNSTVKVSGNGLAELKNAGVSIHLDRDGQYQIANLFAKAQQGQQSSLGTIIGNKVNALAGSGKSDVQTAVGGVRGSDSSGGTVQWADKDEQDTDPITEVETLIAKRDYSTALNRIDAVIKSNTRDIAYARFLRAQILAGMGRSAAASRELANAAIGKGQAHYMEAALLSASVSVDLQDWDKTIATTRDALALKPEVEISQALTLAQALAYRGKSQAGKATELLQSVVSAGADTPSGKEATRLLASK